MIISILLFCLICGLIWYLPSLQIIGFNKTKNILFFSLRLITGIAFAYVYIYHYPKNIIQSDAIRFLHDANVLNDIFYQSKELYFKLLFGFPLSKNDNLELLKNTMVWDGKGVFIVNDFRNVTRFHSIVNFISREVGVHIILICFISHIGLQQLYNSVKKRFSLKSNLFFWILFLLPGILFWTSGVLKEPFIFLAIGLFFRFLFINDKPYNKFFISILIFVLLLCFKPYILLCFIPAILFFSISKLFSFKLKTAILSYATFCILGLGLIGFEGIQLFVSSISRKQLDFINTGRGGLHLFDEKKMVFNYVFPNQVDKSHIKTGYFYPKEKLKIQIYNKKTIIKVGTMYQSNLKRYRVLSNEPPANSYFQVTQIKNDPIILIKTIPEALFNGFLRPFMFDFKSKFSLFSWLENCFMILLISTSIIYKKNLNPKNKTVLVSLLIFAICLYTLIGWTTPVSGAIFRYRFPAQIAMIVICGILLDVNKILSKFKKWES